MPKIQIHVQTCKIVILGLQIELHSSVYTFTTRKIHTYR